MIRVEVRPNSIDVSGHAGVAPRGQSVPCAGVSAMTWMLYKGMTQIVDVPGLVFMVSDGLVSIRWDSLPQSAEDMVDAWYLGMLDIADEYGCVEFT